MNLSEVLSPQIKRTILCLLFCCAFYFSSSAISLSLISLNPTCQNACDGSITATANGGTQPYQYSIDGGLNWQSNSDFTGLCSGTYTITVLDALSATTSSSATLINPLPFIFSASIANCTVYNVCNGSVTISASGGTPPYTYFLTGPVPSSGTFFPGPITVGNLCPGTYSLVVHDSTNCVIAGPAGGTFTFTITQPPPPPPPLTLTAYGDIPVCPYICQHLSGNASGGQPPYQYSFNNGPYSSSTSSPCMSGGAATYPVCVKDALGTIACTVVNVYWPLPWGGATLTGVTSTTPCGACLGSFGIQIMGGGAFPFHYSIQQGTGTWTALPGNGASNLCAGTYNVGVQDNGTCYVIIPLTITSVPITFTTSQVSPCFASCNGSITVTAPGTGPYHYSKDGGTTWQTSNVFNALCAGTYTVTVQNTASPSCTATNTVTLTEQAQFTPSVAITSPTCYGLCNGSFITSVNPAGTYTYSNNGGVSYQSSATFGSQCAGAHSVMVKNAGGCTSSLSFTITQPTQLTSVISGFGNNPCYGYNSGFASVNVAGGSPAYVYNWTPGNPSGDGTPNAMNLTAGTWVCNVTDSHGCTTTQSFLITHPPIITSGVISTSNINCNGGSTGAATISASGGTGVLSYNWSPGNPTGDGTNSVTGLTAGTWTCQITDGNFCPHTQTVNITQAPAIITAVSSQTNISCNGGNSGSATITASGGTGALSYSWTPSGGNSATASGLSQGIYTCTIMDANNCTVTQTVNITEPAVLSSSISSTNISCNGGANGSAIISVSGGTSGYSYNWTPGNPAGDGTAGVSNLTAGTWVCNVTDSHGCITTQSAVITEPVTLSSSVISSSSPDCFGGNNGTASITAAGGTGAISFDWTPGNPAGDGTNAVSGLTAGTWTCQISDANSCVITQTLIISQPTTISSSIASQINVLCTDDNSGSITLFATGGTGVLAYSWSPVPGNSPTLLNLTAGDYTCTITDANSCFITQSVSITQPAVITSSVSSSGVSCNGGTNGSATAFVSGGTPAYSYLWSSGGNNAVENNLIAGTYTCTISDANSCMQTLTITLTEPSPLVNSFSVTNTNCNLCNGSASVNPSGGTGSYSYLWNNLSTQANVQNLCAGIYQEITTDSLGCSDTITVSLLPSAGVTVDSVATTPSPSSFANGTASVYASGNPPLSFAWDNAAGNQVTQTATGLFPGTYCVEITDNSGCTDSVCVTVGVLTGIEYSQNSLFNIFPNPFENKILVSGSGKTHLLLLNSLGQVIVDFGTVALTENGTEIEIPSGLSSGFYIIRGENASGIYTRRLTKK